MNIGIRSKLFGTLVLVGVIFVAMSMTATSTFKKLTGSATTVQRYGRMDDRVIGTEIGASKMQTAQWTALAIGPSGALTALVNESYNGTGDDAVVPANAEALRLAPTAAKADLQAVGAALPAIHEQALITLALVKEGHLVAARTSAGTSAQLVGNMLAHNGVAERVAEKYGAAAKAAGLALRKSRDRQLELISLVGALVIIVMMLGYRLEHLSSYSRGTRAGQGSLGRRPVGRVQVYRQRRDR